MTIDPKAPYGLGGLQTSDEFANPPQAAPGHVYANGVERTHRVIFGGVVALLVALAVVALVARAVA